MSAKDGKIGINVRPAMVQNPTGKEWHIAFDLWGFETEQFREIMTVHLPAWVELFAKKNAEYGAGQQASGTALGEKGQFADIWRKIGKLKTGIWDGNEDALTSESVDEILLDLIGHCFLTLWMRGQTAQPAPADLPLEKRYPELFMGPDSWSPTETPQEQAERVGNYKYTSESYEVREGVWLTTGDVVEFRHHLHRGGRYEVVGFDTLQPDGMVCQIRPSVDAGEKAELSWTNPDWLILVDQQKGVSER